MIRPGNVSQVVLNTKDVYISGNVEDNLSARES
jgi:hypothetical protein